MPRSTLLACALLVGTPAPMAAAPVRWISFDAWVEDASSGSIAYKAGSVDVTLLPTSGLTTHSDSEPSDFDTTSAAYPNIDATIYRGLSVVPLPETTGDPWSIEFDLVGETLTGADAFDIGQLFVSSVGGPFTQLTIEAFHPDDTTPYDLSDLLFEQHTRGPGFTVPLIWDPTTGILRAQSPVSASENTGWGFFKPSSGEIGRIVVSATTQTTTNGDRIVFGLTVPVPEPGTAGLVGLGLVGVAALGRARRSG